MSCETPESCFIGAGGMLSIYIDFSSDYDAFFFCVCMELVLMLMLLYTDKFVVQGIKINTPHYLAKLPKISKGTSTYTVIVSQLDSLSTIYYTLRVRTYIMLYFILL